MTILFVGDANAARSPLAEALARRLLPAHEAWSAGYRPSHVHPEVRVVLTEEGVSTAGLRAKSLAEVPLDDVDVVVSFVDEERALRVPARAKRLRWGIPDPSSAPRDERLEAFRAARDEIARRLRGLEARS
ncbi:MAG: arsenate reductase ArsC [Myxococcota bacterium]